MTKQTPIRGTIPACLSRAARDDIRDNLVLALDELDTGPLDAQALRRLVSYQSAALSVSLARGAM